MTSLPVVEPEVRFVASTGGVEVAVHDHGGDGPPVVFCHATGLHGRAWDPVIAHLRDRFRCLALDLRGHGDARAPTGSSFEWTRIANDLLCVLEAENLQEGVGMVGHSMGGCVVLLAEQRRPGTVRASWLFEPIVLPNGGVGAPGSNPLAAMARRRREVFESKAAAIDRMTGRGPFANSIPEAVAAYVEHGFRVQPDGSVILKCRGETEARVFEGSPGSGAFESLAVVQCPVTIAVSGDGAPPATVGASVVAALPHGRLETWPDLTHFGPLEAPERIAAAIAEALG